MNKFQIQHFTLSPADREWKYLEDGHDTNDSRCMGGAWYYKGDKGSALIKLKEYKETQRKRADSYYAQPWV